jgi:predicted ATPase
MPRLRRLFPDIPLPPELLPEQRGRSLRFSVGDWIARSAQGRPLLLILDDLHWADESTLLVLEQLAERLAAMPAVVLAAYRDVEAELTAPLKRTLAELTRRRLAHHVPLRCLAKSGVEAMLRALSGQEPPPAIAQRLYDETDGNLFFVEEAFACLAEEGQLFDDAGRFRSDVTIGAIQIPASLHLTIGRRVERRVGIHPILPGLLGKGRCSVGGARTQGG